MSWEDIYFLPGIAGSTLGYSSGKLNPAHNILWINKTLIAICRFNDMRSEDGQYVTELSPVACYPDVYRPILAKLGSFARSHMENGKRRFGDVISSPYDFREPVIRTGQLLASAIAKAATAQPGRRATLVCHSMGGLVARAAYHELATNGQEQLIRRVITLSSPHEGSYMVGQTFATNTESVTMVALAKRLSQYLGVAIPSQQNQKWDVVNVIVTWNGVYNLLPNPELATNDPNRKLMFVASSYNPLAKVEQDNLDVARDQFWPVMNESQFWPPHNVMTCVASAISPTPATLKEPSLLGTSNRAYGYEIGDGTVTAASASWDRAKPRTYFVKSRHDWMPRDARVLEALPKWILEEDPQPTPIELKGKVEPSDVPPGPVLELIPSHPGWVDDSPIVGQWNWQCRPLR